jgi:hypothetical protein
MKIIQYDLDAEIETIPIIIIISSIILKIPKLKFVRPKTSLKIDAGRIVILFAPRIIKVNIIEMNSEHKVNSLSDLLWILIFLNRENVYIIIAISIPIKTISPTFILISSHWL